jgi:hypothetical protein
MRAAAPRDGCGTEAIKVTQEGARRRATAFMLGFDEAATPECLGQVIFRYET